MRYLKERKDFLSEGDDFINVKNTIIDREIKIAQEGDFPELSEIIKSLEKLRSEIDLMPSNKKRIKKFITTYKKITGATDYDLPNELKSLK